MGASPTHSLPSSSTGTVPRGTRKHEKLSGNSGAKGGNYDTLRPWVRPVVLNRVPLHDDHVGLEMQEITGDHWLLFVGVQVPVAHTA